VLAWAVGILALLGVLAAGGYAVWTYAIPHYVTVPNVRGLSVSDVNARLRAVGLIAEYPSTTEFSPTVPAGLALRTIPSASARAKKRSHVSVILSAGPEFLDVPNVLGRDVTTAKHILTQRGFVPVVKQDFDETAPEGNVFREVPEPNTKLEKGKQVLIWISKGPPPVQIPNVKNQPADQAKFELENLGFQVSVAKDYSTTVPKDEVISTDPPAGRSVDKGSTVVMTVSLGPKTFKMPDVTGMTKEAAISLLEGKGLKVDVVTLPPSPPPDTVVFQDPQAGTTVQQGETVTIYETAS
jgi:beta-lactam-binding protein with PASTA domain